RRRLLRPARFSSSSRSPRLRRERAVLHAAAARAAAVLAAAARLAAAVRLAAAARAAWAAWAARAVPAQAAVSLPGTYADPSGGAPGLRVPQRTQKPASSPASFLYRFCRRPERLQSRPVV